MPGPLAALLLVVLLPLQALAQPLALAECRSLRQRRDLLAAAAMQAEIALVLATRRRLCPRLEALAEQANAGTDSAGTEAAGAAGSGGPQPLQGQANPRRGDAAPAPQAGQSGSRPVVLSSAVPSDTTPVPTQPLPTGALDAAAPEFDYTAYLDCRRQAEVQLRRNRAVLYSNQSGFTFYTVDGAQLARQADAWQQRLSAGCESRGGS